MTDITHKIQADFDRLALLTDEGWNHNNHYHAFLLQQLPEHLGAALEIGCGTGVFSRLLANRADYVLGVDLSPQMVRLAKQRSAQKYPNLDFEVADVLNWAFPPARFDCIATIATLHHLPFAAMLANMRDALKPNGTLLVLDLYQAQTLTDQFFNALAVPLSVTMKLSKGLPLKEPPEVRAAWAEHARTDKHVTLKEVRRVCATVLPGAKVTRHLIWRYSIVWKKPTI
jgi:ubiquinone/menaquinone biosynthesis C-methylase UbiE